MKKKKDHLHRLDQLQRAVNGPVVGDGQGIIARKASCSKQCIIEGFLCATCCDESESQ